MKKTIALLMAFSFMFLACTECSTDQALKKKEWRISAYCTCEKCCGKWADGKTASGRRAFVGCVACNILPFGMKIYIDGLGAFEVQDRGSKRYFGTMRKPVYAIDIFMHSHEEAKKFGVQYKTITIV